MKVVYVAGPFRGSNSWEMEKNVRRAEELSLAVWRAGFAALCPHTNTRFFQGAAPDEVWIDGTLELLRRCDAVILTADWIKSTGARGEVRAAVLRGMPVYDSVDNLRQGFRLNPGWLYLTIEDYETGRLNPS